MPRLMENQMKNKLIDRATSPRFRVVVPTECDPRIRVEGTDSNGNWVDADPGDRFYTIAEAERAAELWAANRGGQYIGLA